MKTTAERVKHIRENVLKMTQAELLKIVDISGKTLSNLETGQAGDRATRDFATQLGLCLQWLDNGKGPVWIMGTEEDNVRRIKSSGADFPANPLTSEVYRQQERMIDELKRDKSFLQGLLQNLSGNKSVPFLKAPDRTPYPATA